MASGEKIDMAVTAKPSSGTAMVMPVTIQPPSIDAAITIQPPASGKALGMAVTTQPRSTRKELEHFVNELDPLEVVGE